MGYWEAELEPGGKITLAASTRDLGEFDFEEIRSRYVEEIESVRSKSGLPKKFFYLADSAVNHVVRTGLSRVPAIIAGYPYGGIEITDTLLSLDGFASISAFESFEQDFIHELASNEMNGAFPSSIVENTSSVNYDNPQVPLYFAFALARLSQKERSFDIIRRYLPMLESAIEIIKSNLSDWSFVQELLVVERTNKGAEDKLLWVRNASLNASWYNLLRLVEETKQSDGRPSPYSEILSSISSRYFESFFDAGCDYKNSEGINGVVCDMVFPLVVPFSPLTGDQKSKVCAKLVPRFLNSFENEVGHSLEGHACNLTALYLLEAASQAESCKEEFADMKHFADKLLTLQGFTNCVNSLPKCPNSGSGITLDMSSALVTAEAIRLVKKLNLK